MRKIIILLLTILGACAQQRLTTQPQVADAAAGRKLFEQHCASCHGVEGSGTKYAPALSGVQAMDSAELFRFVTNGNLRRGMPSWSRLPEQRRWQIVAFLKKEDRQNRLSPSER
jgi:mono/diheme cytochrome c family protein